MIYLVRHTTPDITKGLCYGQLDMGVTGSFEEEAKTISSVLPDDIQAVFSSPLQRCRVLANYLFPRHDIRYRRELMEIHCGEWEGRLWDEIPSEEVQPWMDDFVNKRIPGGESYVEVFERVVNCYKEIVAGELSAAIIAHGGVIRSILAYLTGTALIDSFKEFRLHYGCVVKVEGKKLEYLSNIEREREQHKPRK